MAETNDELIQRWYSAFARYDGDAMAACYAPGARFSDPVFTDLCGEEPAAMWRTLVGRAEDLVVRLAELEGTDHRQFPCPNQAVVLRRHLFGALGLPVAWG